MVIVKVEYLKEFVSDAEIRDCSEVVPRGKSQDFYLGLKTGIAIASSLLKLFDRVLISRKLAAILINLEGYLHND